MVYAAHDFPLRLPNSQWNETGRNFVIGAYLSMTSRVWAKESPYETRKKKGNDTDSYFEWPLRQFQTIPVNESRTFLITTATFYYNKIY